MDKAQVPTEEKKNRVLREQKSEHTEQTSHADTSLVNLQKLVGNRAVQRLLLQRDSSQSFELDEETAKRVENERGSGQALDRSMQEKMGSAMGHDFSDVRVHTSPEADALNQNLNAEAFTTGNDIYFRAGAYDPNSSGGQELLAHEMTHVVQQSNGLAGGETKMTVNAPDDAYEKNADAMAHAAVHHEAGTPGVVQTEQVQRQEIPEEEEELQTRRVQRQEIPEEEELQTHRMQRQETSEEEEKLKKGDLEEEEIQTKKRPGWASGKM